MEARRRGRGPRSRQHRGPGLAGFRVGGKVYIRKSDGTLVSNPGSEGTTVWLENVRMKQPQRGSGNTSEVVVTGRNIQ